jgi:3-keto steroid reductase
VDEFAKSYPDTHRLTVVFTTRRPPAQVRSTRDDLTKYAARHGAQLASRVQFLAETLDLFSLHSVRALSRRLNRNFTKLDAIILNAGWGGWSGLNWPMAVFKVLTDMVNATTWPTYKLSKAGVTTPRQTELAEEKPLSAVFCANVFGHYMLAHNVMPLLRRSGKPNGPGRVIWISSIEATTSFFDVDDIQALKSAAPYESSKALSDILALTSDLPSTAPWVKSFLAADSSESESSKEPSTGPPPINYVSHPGIFGSSIVPLIMPLWYCMLAAFYISRLLGSPWHTVTTYIGANAPVWLTLSPQEILDEAEKPYRENGGGHSKWGSSTDRFGRPRVANTELDGWGYGGVVGRPPVVPEDRTRRRKPGMKLQTAEDRLQFEELGRRSWQYMEELRIEWDRLLDVSEKSQ